MKKILLVHNKYRHIGGEDIAVEQEIEFLKDNYQVETLFFHNSISNYISDIKSFLFSNNNKSLEQLKEVIKKFNPDVVYVHNTWFKASLGIFKLLEKERINTIIKLHNFRYYCTQHFSSKKHLARNKYCLGCGYNQNNYRFFNKYFSESYLKSFFVILYGRKYFKILKKGNIKIIVLTQFHKNFLEKIDDFNSKIFVHQNPLRSSQKGQVLKKEDYIIYAGRLSKEKGVDKLISAFLDTNLSGVHLKIVGDGPLSKVLKEKYQNMSQIHFEGVIANDQVLNLIAGSRAVVTATRLWEGQPTLLCEASLLGVPSIFPNTGGIGEFFPANYDLSFEQFNYKELQKKLEIIINKEDMNRIGKTNQDFILNYLNTKKLQDTFNMITNEK